MARYWYIVTEFSSCRTTSPLKPSYCCLRLASKLSKRLSPLIISCLHVPSNQAGLLQGSARRSRLLEKSKGRTRKQSPRPHQPGGFVAYDGLAGSWHGGSAWGSLSDTASARAAKCTAAAAGPSESNGSATAATALPILSYGSQPHRWHGTPSRVVLPERAILHHRG